MRELELNGDVAAEGSVVTEYSDETARTYDIYGAEVLIVDGWVDHSGETFDPDCKLTYLNPIPVIRGFGKGIENVIGSAHLYRIGKSICADIFLRYDCPERLELQAEGEVYPAIGGRTLNVRFDGHVKVMTEIEITELSLQFTRNADPRIKPL